MNIQSCKYFPFFLLFAFWLNAVTSYGAAIESAATGNWNQTSTWVGGIIPDAGDDVVIKANHSVTLSDTRACAAVLVEANAFLTLSGNLTQSGTFTINGLLILNGGSHTFSNNFTGIGTLNITGATTINVPSNFAPALPTVNQSTTLNASAATDLTILNGTTWNWVGDFGANFTAITNDGTLNIVGVANHNTPANITNNAGKTINWTDGVIDNDGGGQTLTNNGIFNLIGNNPNNVYCKMPIVNKGTMSKTAGTLTVAQNIDNQAGATATLATGATLTFTTGNLTQSGTFTVNGTVIFNGSATHVFHTNFAGTGTLQINSATTITAPSGFAPALPIVSHSAILTASATTTLTILNGTHWVWAGDFGGAFTAITNDGTLSIFGDVNHNTPANITNNAGKTINWTGGMIDANTGGQTLTNHGIFNLIGNNPNNVFCNMPIVNTGTLNKTAGTLTVAQNIDNQAGATATLATGATLTFTTGNLTQSGTFTVNGTVIFNGSATHVFHTNFAGTGTLQINSATTITAPSGFAPALPIVSHSAILTASAATTLTILNGTHWVWAGDFGGAFTAITNDGTLSIFGDVNHNTLANITNNAGKTINWTGGVIDNNGGGQTLTNNGIFNLIGNNSNNVFCNMPIINTGTVIKTAGTLNIVQPFDNQSTGIIKGLGTLTFTSTLTNDGQIEPGLSPGIITLNRAAGLPVNDLAIEVAGNAGPGTGHDQLQSANTVNIIGDLSVTLLNSFEPTIGSVYTILTYASRTGTFASVTPDCWTVTYGATSTTITYEPDTWYADTDNDGYGDASVSQIACNQPSGYVSNDDDCDDSNAAVNPAATEICNGIDDDCDSLTDDADPSVTGQSTWYADADSDGFGNAAVSQLACEAPSSYVSNADDCDDSDTAVNPSATEICNGIDDDCDGQTDEDLPVFIFYADADGDGYGNAASMVQNCTALSGYVSDNTDCDDSNAAIHPGAAEICNNVDDDCDGETDEGVLLIFYADADGDGYGNAAVTTQACSAPPGYVNNPNDCNDSNDAVHPGAAEICNNVDDDCDGLLNEGTPDGDGDGVCDAIDNCPITYNPGQADNEGDGIGDVCDSNDDNDPKPDHQDCAPFNPNIYPGAPEICGNLIDDDCDNKIDDPLGIQTISEQDVLCNGQATGAITVTGACGLPPYTYIWTNGATTATITGLVAGSYKVTVTDAQGLTKTKSHSITQPTALNVSMTKTDVGCFGGSDGKATANPSGGKSPYTYAWSNGGTTKTITGLTTGAYIVTVTDFNGCTKIGGIEIYQPTPLVITDLLVEPDPAHPGKFQVAITASGGTPYTDGYRYRRCNSGGTGCTSWQVSNVLVNIPAGNYIVRVKDKNACETGQSVLVGGTGKPGNGNTGENKEVESRDVAVPEFDIRLYPNPASTEINVFVSGYAQGESVFEMTDFTGKAVRRTDARPVPGEVTQLDLVGLPTGTYLLRWSSVGKILATKVFLVVQE